MLSAQHSKPSQQAAFGNSGLMGYGAGAGSKQNFGPSRSVRQT